MQNVLSQVEMAPFEFEGGEQSDGATVHCGGVLLTVISLSASLWLCWSVCVSLPVYLSHTGCLFVRSQ